jgi:hypothetical protein
MIQKVLSGLGGIEVYGILSIALFFAVFLGVLIWALGLRRPFLDRMSRLPLDGEPTESAAETESVSSSERHE